MIVKELQALIYKEFTWINENIKTLRVIWEKDLKKQFTKE